MNGSGFNHVSVTCADLDRSLDFYAGVLGLPVLSQGEVASPDHAAIIGLGDVRMRFAELDFGGGLFLELFEYLEPRGEPVSSRTCDPGNVHLAVNVADAHAVHGALTAAGAVTRSAPVTVTRGDWRGAKVFYAVDPDGVTVEIIERAHA